MERPTDYLIAHSERGVELTLQKMKVSDPEVRSYLSDLMQYYRAINRMAVTARELEQKWLLREAQHKPRSRSQSKTKVGSPAGADVRNATGIDGVDQISNSTSETQRSLAYGVPSIGFRFGAYFNSNGTAPSES